MIAIFAGEDATTFGRLRLGCSKPPPTLLPVFRSGTCQDDCVVESAQPSAALWNETESRAAVVGTAQENQCVHRSFHLPNPKLRTSTAARPSESCREVWLRVEPKLQVNTMTIYIGFNSVLPHPVPSCATNRPRGLTKCQC